MFASAVMQALYSLRVLDEMFKASTCRFPNDLVLSYLAYRIAREPMNGNPLLRCMRRVVDVIGETGGDADQEPGAIEGSIRSMLIPMTKRQFKKIVRWEGEVSEAEYEKSLFAAGVRVNSLAVVQRSLM
jgi:hypothetical protein